MLNKNCENVNPQNVITRGKSLTLTVPEVGGDSGLLRLVMRSTSSSLLVLYRDVDTLESNTVETGTCAFGVNSRALYYAYITLIFENAPIMQSFRAPPNNGCLCDES